jgi:hypothetical protein
VFCSARSASKSCDCQRLVTRMESFSDAKKRRCQKGHEFIAAGSKRLLFAYGSWMDST